MKKTILLNGAIRDTEEFLLIVDYILHKKLLHRADTEIVISTWHDDINANLPFFSWLVSQDIRVVGSASIDEGGPANIFRQWRTLEAGLSVIDSDRLVLKGRTDKFLLRKDVIDAFLLLPEDSAVLEDLKRNDRLAIEHISISLPFMAKDMVYLGTVAAIRRTLHYSVRTQFVADHIFNGIGPECFLWLELCRHQQFVMTAIQALDLRVVSNQLTARGIVDQDAIDQLEPDVLALFNHWFRAIDDNLLFLSDVLPCSPTPSWVIDEGSWRYQIGDRKDYEDLKNRIRLVSTKTENRPLTTAFINSTKEYQTFDTQPEQPKLSFANLIDQIRNSAEREYSDIVLLRQAVIDEELTKSTPDNTKLTKALHWNIRQRDRNTLKRAYDWLMEGANQGAYLSEADKIFVIERMVDLFTFSGSGESIERTILTLPQYFKSTAQLRTRVAEYYFSKRRLYKALYWFILSYRLNSKGLGVNHGLGCTLLDLGFPRLSLKFLRQAHATMPADQTAAFTLTRALVATGRMEEARILKQSITGNLRIEAERMFSV